MIDTSTNIQTLAFSEDTYIRRAELRRRRPAHNLKIRECVRAEARVFA